LSEIKKAEYKHRLQEAWKRIREVNEGWNWLLQLTSGIVPSLGFQAEEVMRMSHFHLEQ
jgi:hypothetical protein